MDSSKIAQAPHSDLEVVPQADAPEAQKYAYYSPTPQHAIASDTDKVAYGENTNTHEPTKAGTICGLRKRTFWILVIVAVIIVAAAVGGGVGGALGSKSSRKNDNNSAATGTGAAQSTGAQSSGAQSTSSMSPTPTVPQSSTVISSTTIVGPSSSIVRDCPSSNYTLYDVALGDNKQTFRKACSVSFFNSNGIDSVVNTPVKSLNDCINLCATYNVNSEGTINKGGRVCNSVCWRNTYDTTVNDFTGGQCFGFTSNNVSGQFNYRTPAETRCDSAALITAPF